MNRKSVEKTAYEILKKYKMDSLPIEIKDIVKKEGLQILPYDSKGNFSGILIIKDGNGIIGYNPTESEVRQRFTFAHELGHFILHKNRNDMFIDNHFKVLFRDEQSSKGEFDMEQEANAFAAAILMPEQLIRERITKLNFDLGDEKCLVELANLFNVSVQAMTYRIINLKLL